MNAALVAGLRTVSLLSPRSPDPPEELSTALGLLGVDLQADTVVRASDGAVILVAILGLPLLVVVPVRIQVLATTVLVGAAAGTGYVVRAAPERLARARRSRALGTAPLLVSRAVLRMRIGSTAERAATFAARGDGPLAANLAAHVRRARGTPRSGFRGFAEEWESRFPALGRAVVLLETAAAVPAAERDRILDRANETVLDGTRDRAATFAANIRGPATAVYAFGVLLPLALLGVLPAARVAGLPLGLPAVLVVYDVLLPTGLVWATIRLLSRRPVAFPPCRVPRSHPAVPDNRWRPVLSGFATGTVAWLLAGVVVAAWAQPLAAVGTGLGAGLVVRYRPIRSIRQWVRAVEGELADALALVGRRVKNGTPVERAVDETADDLEGGTADDLEGGTADDLEGGTADDLEGGTGAVFAAASRRQHQLGVGIRAAFLGDRGALEDVPSPRARSAADLLAVAAREGRPAGDAVVSMADHMEDLVTVEREARRQLRQVTATLGNTAAIFAPLVGGATVALAEAMASTEIGATVPTAGLGTAVGAYVLVLAVVLTTLGTGLERGLDRSLVGYRVGVALLSSTVVYLATFVGVDALL